ncbi:hypothetical protein BLOT_001463 [Blomia tropicalis]|nr:hypothetical protein BLOT_001463 [Blomia tropicalis]
MLFHYFSYKQHFILLIQCNCFFFVVGGLNYNGTRSRSKKNHLEKSRSMSEWCDMKVKQDHKELIELYIRIEKKYQI